MTYETIKGEHLWRTREGLGVWEHRGKVAAVGIGHSPTLRRWDWRPETSIGAWTIRAVRDAIADAGVAPGEVDGLALVVETTTGGGESWPTGREIPADFRAMFHASDNDMDGLTRLSPEWLLKNVPELTNVRTVILAPSCMTHALTSAIQAVGDGLATTCVVVKGWHNLDGRYGHGGVKAQPLLAGPFATPWAWVYSMGGPACYTTAMQFQRYLHKYGKTHDMVAPFVVNSRQNGLLFPEGYFAQHSPAPLTAEDYNSARWIAEPANLLDNDLPVHAAAAYVVTTAERARDMRQPPVYVLGHAGAGSLDKAAYYGVAPRGIIETLEEAEENAAATGRKVYESAAIGPGDLSFENMFDGFPFLHVFHIEGLGYAGVKRGEGLDLMQGDISIGGPHPVSPSGGNIGSGRTRFWMHTDSIQQIQGRAGARQIARPPEIGISGGPTTAMSNVIVWSATPD